MLVAAEAKFVRLQSELEALRAEQAAMEIYLVSNPIIKTELEKRFGGQGEQGPSSSNQQAPPNTSFTEETSESLRRAGAGKGRLRRDITIAGQLVMRDKEKQKGSHEA